MDVRTGHTTSTGKGALGALALAFALLCGAGVPAGPAHAQAATSARIGYVDMKRLIDNAPQVIAARARLDAEFATRNTQLDADAARLQRLEEQLRSEAAVMSADDAERLGREVNALRRSIERTRSRLQQEFGERVDQELGSAWPAMEAAVADYAREAGYDLVLSSPQLYASGRIDITDRVLDRLRRQAADGAAR
jgi:outer membrane protein